MDSQKMKQLVEDGSSSSSDKKVDGVKAPTKLFDLNLLPEDSEEEEEEDDDDEFYFELFGSVGETPQVDLNLPNNEVVEANSNELVVPQFPTGGDNNVNGASIIFNNNTTTTSSATKMVTPSHHPFDDKRKLIHPNDDSSTSSGTSKSLRTRRPEPNHDRRICTNYNCRTRNTPMWRKGPLGPKTLCNACGIQYKKQVSSRGSDLEVVEANSNGLVVPQFPTSGGDNNVNGASIIYNTTTTTNTSMATKMVTPSHHPFDDKRKLVHPNDGSSTSSSTPKSLRTHRLEPNHDRRICTNYNCRTRNTPMWRKEPLGPKTLCNACGIQYKKQVSSRGSDLV